MTNVNKKRKKYSTSSGKTNKKKKRIQLHFILFKRKREIRLLSLYIYNEICCLLWSLKNVLWSFNQCISSFIDNNFNLYTRQMRGYWDVLRLSFKSFSFMPLYELQSWHIFFYYKQVPLVSLSDHFEDR